MNETSLEPIRTAVVTGGHGYDVVHFHRLFRSLEGVDAWTRRYRNARVFCFQSGHDNQTWPNANFQTVLARGIQWCAGRV